MALGEGKPPLAFAHRYTSGSPAISEISARNLDNGQRELSKAIWSAFRDPLSHEPVTTIQELGIISHHDCLDALSLMSHLRRRLDDGLVTP